MPTPTAKQRLLKKINDMRIKNKLIFSFILVVFIPVLIVGVFLTASYRQDVLDQATEQTLNNVEKIKRQTSDIISMPIDISDKLLADTRLTDVVNTQYKTTFEAVKALWDYREFRDYMVLYNEIYNIRFYTTNKTILDNWEFMKTNDAIENAFWYRTAINEEGIHWFYIHDETKGNEQFLSLVRKIVFPQYRTNGVLVVGVNQNELNAMLSKEPFDTMIFDENGYIVASSDNAQVGGNIEALPFASQLTDKQPGTYEFEYEGKPSKIVIEELTPPSSRNSLKIVSVFSIDSIVSEANRVSLFGLGIISVSLLIAVMLIYVFSTMISRRMLTLNKDINKLALGDLNVTSTIEGADEIGLLSRQFNNMVGSIRMLMEEVEESHEQQTKLKLHQKEIKLKMMANQINPHFLFNALESIRMKAHMNGEKEISNIVRMLGRMIRRNLEIGARNIPLKEEIQMIGYYLEIQKFRYGDERLAFNVTMDEEAEKLLIPPLIIQPLVENAVVHGLDNRSEGGFVSVTAVLEDGDLLVEVADNGMGINEARIAEIYRSLNDFEEEDGYRIGLRNVHQRLILTYGETSGLRIASVSGEGTRISFRIAAGGIEHV
ncbi:sensor histidine kinase [Paenibacillus thailandensis]|uniref:Sensor histidine kinase n=1 Tax=Paenibacillus thailandensis TaxID=393250 RepID=A0ABW5QSG2_9BACL